MSTSSPRSFAHRTVLSWLGVALLACGSQGEAQTPAPTPTAAAEPARTGIEVRSVDLFQAVRIPLTTGVEPVEARNAPVIAGRPAALRVFYKQKIPTGNKAARFEAALTLFEGDKEVWTRSDVRSSVSSSESNESSTFNFKFAAEDMAPGRTLALSIRSPEGAVTRIPETGTLPLEAAESATVTLKLVPVRYQTDGANLEPAIEADQIAEYKRRIETMYPTAKVDVSIREEVAWDKPIDGDGTGWDELLNAIGDVRASDAAENNVFYMGLFRSQESIRQYCRRGCVLGLAPLVPSASASSMQFALSAAWGGEGTANTIAHELGHNLGRNHSPCGSPASPDRKYPYEDASIGVWGYTDGMYLDPSVHTDIMGYCDNQWISDYTYKALFTRLTQVDARRRLASPKTSAHAAGEPVARVDAKGDLHWTRITTAQPSEGTSVDLEFHRGGSMTHAVGQFIPYDHLPGGYLTLPQLPVNVEMVRAHLPTGTRTLSRVLRARF